MSPAAILERLAVIAIVLALLWISPFRPKRIEYQILVALLVILIVIMGGLAWQT